MEFGTVMTGGQDGAVSDDQIFAFSFLAAA